MASGEVVPKERILVVNFDELEDPRDEDELEDEDELGDEFDQDDVDLEDDEEDELDLEDAWHARMEQEMLFAFEQNYRDLERRCR